MKLNDIISISGQPGLFKFVAQGAGGIIVESLLDGKRTNARGSAKVSSLVEIAIYTDSDEVPLNKILETLFEKTGGKETISHKSEPAQLKALFAEILPDYDRDRVHVSDMKKLVSWYNILVGVGMTDFSVEEPSEEEEETEKKEEKKEPKKAAKKEPAKEDDGSGKEPKPKKPAAKTAAKPAAKK